MLGAPTTIDPVTLNEVLRHINESFAQAVGEGKPQHKLIEIKEATKKIVAGNLYKVQAVVGTVDGSKDCSIDLWLKPWMGFRELSLKCADGHNLKVQTNDLAKPFTQSPTPMPESQSFHGCDDDDDAALMGDIHMYTDSDRKHFEKFKFNFGRNYAETEEPKRFNIFQRNLAKIRRLNRCEQGSATYGVTDHADLTEDEFKQYTGLLQRNDAELNNEIGNALADIPDIDPPASFDWRDHNAITPVKNQESCGSCWAVSYFGF